VKFFDSSHRRAIEDFGAYAAERAIAFSDLEAINEDENARQLSILDPLVAGKRFAYIGEPDHFIHEKYAYRLTMLNYLAGRGFTHVGEEIGASDGMRIALYRNRRRIAARARHDLRILLRFQEQPRRHSHRCSPRQLRSRVPDCAIRRRAKAIRTRPA
jgi:erythromycin esterase-like protein